MSTEDDWSDSGWSLAPAIGIIYSTPDTLAISDRAIPSVHHFLSSSDGSQRASDETRGDWLLENEAAVTWEDDGEDLTVTVSQDALEQRRSALRRLLLENIKKPAGGRHSFQLVNGHGVKLGDGLIPPTFQLGSGVGLPDSKTFRVGSSPSYEPSSPNYLGIVSNGTPVAKPTLAGEIAHSDSPPSTLNSRKPWPVSIPYLSTPREKEIRPLDRRSAAERKAQLVTKLIRSFPNEGKYLLRLPELRSSRLGVTRSSDAIHVFVDCSNILIGFFDTLKKSRGISMKTRTRRVPFSFHSFALILERGRPVAKRILVGSRPLTPALSEAEQCGYETSILERVMKARELPLHLRRTGNGAGTTSGASSSSDAIAGPPQRMVEQAVDEILHLKILESLVDVTKPSTIVLASGDAAEAEYSGGFLKMVERALEKGWSVELVSFTGNTSSAYRRRNFAQKWKKQFRVIALDSYAEELLDM